MAADLCLIRRPCAEDAIALADNLRPADRDEIVAANGGTPREIIAEALRVSIDAWAIERHGRLVAMWGIAPVSWAQGVMCPWLLATPELARIPRMLARLSAAYLARVAADWPLLVNYVDARNAVSVRWLARLGFTIQPAEPFGVAGLPFHRFELRSPPAPCATRS